MILFVLLGMLLFWVVPGIAVSVEGTPTSTLVTGTPTSTYTTGTPTATYSGDGSPPGGGGGGGGGSGGGGGASGEAFSNIIVKEKYDMHIYKDKTTSYVFTNSSNPISSVDITGNVNAGEINTAVEVLRNTSVLVKSPPPGKVYSNINIWVGTYGFALPRNIKEAVIKFKVANSWIDENNVARSDVKMVRWDGSQWMQIETKETSTDNTYTYYDAMTDSFSSFAISGINGVAVPVATRAAAVTTAAGPTQTANATKPGTTEKAPGFELLLAITILGAIYLFRQNKK